MATTDDRGNVNRRGFLKGTAAAIGAAAFSGQVPAVEDDGLDYRNHRPDRMPYRRLGRTKFMASRLIFGCGAALAGGKAVRLLDRAYEAGINYYDVGSNDYYKGAENHLAPFAKRHRGDIWITSKGYARSSVPHEPGTDVSVEYAKVAADYWLRLVDQSLVDLDTDYMDAYFIQGENKPSLVRSEEMARAFEKVKGEGKVGHVGVSTHQNAQAVLEAAVDTGRYDLVMLAVTPAGWYDWKNRTLLEGTAPLTELRPVLDKARAAGVGLIGMKVGRYIAPRIAAGAGDPAAFDAHYDDRLLNADLSPHQRAYAYVLEHGLDAVNADMQTFNHFEENLLAATTSHTYFA